MLNGFYVWDDDKQFDYSTVPAENWLNQMNLIQYNGEATIAGASCSDWTIENPYAMTTNAQSHICLSAEGVILRYEYRGGAAAHWDPSSTDYLWQYGESIVAESVKFEPLSRALFAIPKGYTQKPLIVIP